MPITRKLQKFLSLDRYHSARAAIRRWSYPLDPKPFIDAIDLDGFEKLRARFGKPGEKIGPEKFFDLEEWMGNNVKRVRDIRLPKAPPRLRILDLGCGTGYFLHIARCMGHDVLGLDLDIQPIYNETIRLLGIPRVVHAIQPFQPMPDLGAPFDLITAHLTCFNWHADGTHWGVEEWRYFLQDVESRLTPTGWIQLELNVLSKDQHMAPEVKKFFLSKGARIDRRRVFLPPRSTTKS
jgi:SAM-dependent methyltransferase